MSRKADLTDVNDEAPDIPDEPVLPAEKIEMTFAQMLELAKAFSGSALDAKAIADIAATAATKAGETLKEKWWNEATFPHISAYNPKGERAHPRDDLNGMVFWGGYLLQKDTLVQEEIELVNQLYPGEFWVRTNADVDILVRVQNLEPAGSPTRRLLVLFPCQTQDQRQDLPSMRRMLYQILHGPGTSAAA